MSGISFSGVGSGLDTKSIVNALVAAEMVPQREALKARQSNITSQLSAFGRLKSAMTAFQTTLNDLRKETNFQHRSATLSNDKYFSISTTAKATPGQFSVEVQRLAEPQKLITQAGAFATGATEVGTGSLDITSGSDSFTVNIGDGSKTLAGIRDAINASKDNDSVNASIVNVDDGFGGTEARLILTARNTGLDNVITVVANDADAGNGPNEGLNRLSSANLVEQQAAADALILVDGLSATRSSNSISDVIEGVTLDLKEAELGKETIVTIDIDKKQIGDNVQKFVDAYNALRGVMKDLSGNEKSVLLGDSTLRTLSIQLRNEISSPVATAESDNNILSLVGVTIDKDGRMSLDRTKLDKELDANPGSIASLFASEDGVASRLYETVQNYTQAGGLLENRTKGLDARMKSANAHEERLDRREENLFTRLTRQYNAMDSLVGSIRSSGDFLVAQLSAMNNSRF
ncbi:flagellar filament capping protein FliD [Nitrincola sp. MINF-07-Sa-05]|uniref:flagellar filament capping protein FliD n=1 Tax=Nitrincola salilacus TaxID=3400273 RepID=UPI003917E206